MLYKCDIGSLKLVVFENEESKMPNYVGLTPKKTLNQFTSRLKHYYTGVVGLH